ncbi:MAG: hypothetical protein M3Y64_08125, partial [Gemmatimonadota bacterium]|nr:hypothetical protein [Gemmatimonadota bacterium]
MLYARTRVLALLRAATGLAILAAFGCAGDNITAPRIAPAVASTTISTNANEPAALSDLPRRVAVTPIDASMSIVASKPAQP